MPVEAIVLVIALLAAVLGAATGCAADGKGDSGGTSPAGARTVELTTDDGVALSAGVFGEGERGVVLLHMYPADQSSWWPMAEHLAADGFLVLTLDFRGYGGSGGERDIGLIDRDVRAAVVEMGRQGAASVVLVGASMGGTAALVAADAMQEAGGDPPVVGVATLSAPVEFEGLSAALSVAGVTAPKLFLGTEGDSGGAAARQLYESAAEPRAVEVYPGDEHGTDMLLGEKGAVVRERIDAWLAEVFGDVPAGGAG